MRRGLLGLLVLATVACDGSSAPGRGSRPGPEASADELAIHLGARLGHQRALSKLDARRERVLVGLADAARSETDHRPLYELYLWRADDDSLTRLGERGLAAALSDDALLVVREDGALWRVARGSARQLVEGAQGRPAVLANGEVVVAHGGAEPGESDLVRLHADGRVTPLAPAPGPDDAPTALPDGRVAFVSGRTTVASIWLVEPDTGALEQLTNRGLLAGRPWRGFVPPPMGPLTVKAGRLEYDSGNGQRWRIELGSGAAARVDPGGTP